jgi:hypothetical protein
MWVESGWTNGIILRRLSHAIDTVLLGSALGLVGILHHVSVRIFVADGENIALDRLHLAGHLCAAVGKNTADATRVLNCSLVRLRLHHQCCNDLTSG